MMKKKTSSKKTFSKNTLSTLSNKIFKNGEVHALRDGFGSGLMLCAKNNEKVWALSADLTESNRMNDFQKKYTHRFVEVGVAEQNLIGIATGLSRIGMIPFAASFAVFSPGRSWDQVRVSVCYSNANVKIYGGHAGLTVGEDGATHEALEDIAITRVLPNMVVLVPSDAKEMERATIAAAKHQGPVYIRGSRAKTTVFSEKEPFTIGKANLLKKGSDVSIIACGIMVEQALLAASELEKENIHCDVLNMHTIKPLDVDAIKKSVQKTRCIVTAEEHQITGGLGSCVLEALSDEKSLLSHFPQVIRVGMKDSFGESGSAHDLLKKYDLTKDAIIRAAKTLHKQKNKK